MSEVKLLPLPEPGEAMSKWAYHETDMESYARANMEPLLEEVAGLKRILGPVSEEAIEMRHEAVAQKRRAERLAEALRDALEYLKHHLPDDMLEMHRAALDQEGGNG